MANTIELFTNTAKTRRLFWDFDTSNMSVNVALMNSDNLWRATTTSIHLEKKKIGKGENIGEQWWTNWLGKH